MAFGSLLVPEAQFFDNSGAVLAGGKIYFYAAGTLTPQNTYSDGGLVTPNANPVVLDSAGRAAIFLSPLAYKVIAKTSADVTLWTLDNVYPSGYVATQATAVVVQNTSLTGTQNDFALDSQTAPVLILRCANAAALTVNGFQPPTVSQRLIIESIGAGDVFLAHQNASSTAADRLINTATSGLTPLKAGVGTAEYVYDLTTARWRLVTHRQGGFLTATFAAGDFTAVTAGTWTVGSGDRTTLGYELDGNRLTVAIELATTTVAQSGGNPTLLAIANGQWGGFTATKAMAVACIVNDNGGGNLFGFFDVPASGTTIRIARSGSAQWSNSTDNTSMYGEITLEVN